MESNIMKKHIIMLRDAIFGYLEKVDVDTQPIPRPKHKTDFKFGTRVKYTHDFFGTGSGTIVNKGKYTSYMVRIALFNYGINNINFLDVEIEEENLTLAISKRKKSIKSI